MDGGEADVLIRATIAGDVVRIEETRPLSKMKHWRLVEILKRGSGIVPVEVVLSEADPDLTSITSADTNEEESE